MLRTLTVGLSGRAVSVTLLFLPSFSLAATAGEMTSSPLIGNARVDIMIERTTLPLPVKGIFRWVKSAAEPVTSYYGRFPGSQVLIPSTPSTAECNRVKSTLCFPALPQSLQGVLQSPA
jgi:hypothetical protein